MLVLIKQLTFPNYNFRVVIIPLGVIVIQLLNKSIISISVALENDGTYQVLFLDSML